MLTKAVVFATHELTKSRTRAKNQAVAFATHEFTKSRARAKNQVVVFAAYERTNSRTHDIKKKMRRLCLLHPRTKSRTHDVSRKKGVLGLLATTNQLAKVKKKINSFMSSWLEAKMSLLFLYFQSVQVTNSRTWDCWLEFVSSCVHNPNRLSLNLFGCYHLPERSDSQKFLEKHNHVKQCNIFHIFI